jgi:sugar (pentulose or hexulose) kinase
MQIMADITDRPVERPHTYEASILGTAVNMAVALGHYPSYAAAVAGMVRVKDRFEPDGTYALLYQKIYDQIYTKLYDQLSPLYDRLQSIVGYPAE